MGNVEIDFVVKDSLHAIELYEKIFELEDVQVTDFPQGQNEVLFTLYDVHFHMLDENPEFQLFAPKPEDPKTMWVNVTVPDIQSTYNKALKAGCQEIQTVTEIPDFGVSNAMFMDPFGYIWLLHQVHKEMSFDEMKQKWEGKME